MMDGIIFLMEHLHMSFNEILGLRITQFEVIVDRYAKILKQRDKKQKKAMRKKR